MNFLAVPNLFLSFKEHCVLNEDKYSKLIWIHPALPTGEGNGTPLQFSCLENPMDGEAWWAAVHGVAKSLIRLSNFTFTFHFHAWEKEMATHSSVLAWRTPGTGEPGGLPSMGSHRVGYDWSDLAAAAAAALPTQGYHNTTALSPVILSACATTEWLLKKQSATVHNSECVALPWQLRREKINLDLTFFLILKVSFCLRWAGEAESIWGRKFHKD